MTKAQLRKFKRLPEFKIFTIWYDDYGKITNLDLMIEMYQYYHFEDVIHNGRSEGKNWVDYMLSKRKTVEDSSLYAELYRGR